MIVVATYNGYWALTKLVKALETYGTDNHKVVIVDNGTNDLVSKKFLQELSVYQGSLDLTVLNNDSGFGYEAGAVVKAVRSFPDEEKLIFLQDSCEPTGTAWISMFDEKLTPEVGAVNWVRFRPCLFWCFDHHLQYIDSICGGHDNVPVGGFFGNIFYTYVSILKDFDAKGYFNNLPTQKFHSEAWERIWAILFHINGFKTECLIDGYDCGDIHYGRLPNLKKTFTGRV